MARGAQQLGLVSEALVVTLTAAAAQLPAVLCRALTLPVALPSAAPLALPVAVADLPVGPQHVAGPAVGPEVVLGAAHLQLVHTQPLPEVWPDMERVMSSLSLTSRLVLPRLWLQRPPGLDVLLPVPVVDVALHLAPAHVLAQLLGDLGQPDLTGGVLLTALLLPGRVPALQLAPLGPLHPRLEAGHQVGAGPAGWQLG